MKKKLLNNIFIWGTGMRAQELNEWNGCELECLDIVGYIDNDEKKWGNDFYGKKIFSPEILRCEGNKKIYIANRFEKEIRQQIELFYADCDIEIIDEYLISRIQIILRYENSDDPEIKEIVHRLKSHPLAVFNYPFVEKYDMKDIKVEFDTVKKLFFTDYCGKKMYFSRKFKTVESVKEYYKSILLEQDDASPHLYITDDYKVQEGAIVVDAGVAEGNFSLSIIDSAKKIYMFEPDRNWYEALLYTFEPYKDKVVIINKYLSNYENSVTTTIDKEVSEKINFIKMDIEGEEIYALRGAEKTIEKSDDLRCLICTYHQEFAFDIIRKFFDEKGIISSNSKGYMWYPDGGLRAPVLRRGILRASKKTNLYGR